MKIIVARNSGFCMGVRIAVNTILKTAHETGGPIETLGPLIHNPPTMEMLRKKRVTAVKNPSEITADTVFIRTHGVPPGVKDDIERKKVRVIDATCPHVKRIQTIIAEHRGRGYDIIIFGDANHAEVEGLMGFAGERGHVIASPADLTALPRFEKACLVAQTTQSLKGYQEVKRAALALYPDAAVFDTICRATDSRQTEVERLARENDAVIVVGGKNSANSTRLAEIARHENPRVFHIETEEELVPAAFSGIRSVAVVSGASTPSWLLNRVTAHLAEISDAQRPFLLRQAAALVRMVVFSDLYLGLGAVLITWAASKMQGHAPDYLQMAVAGLYINSMYILNHLTNIEANRYEEIFKKDYILRHRGFSMAVCVVTGLLSVALAWRLGHGEFVLILLACLAGIIYHVTLLPKNNLPLLRHRRLKDIALSKDLGISIAWSAVCVMPSRHADMPAALSDPGVLTALVFVFTLVFARSIFHDLHDIQRDLVVGRETIPILLGKKIGLVYPYPLLALLAAVPLAGVAAGWIAPAGAALALVPAYLYVIHFNFKRNRFSDPLIFDLLVDLAMVLPFLLLLAAGRLI